MSLIGVSAQKRYLGAFGTLTFTAIRARQKRCAQQNGGCISPAAENSGVGCSAATGDCAFGNLTAIHSPILLDSALHNYTTFPGKLGVWPFDPPQSQMPGKSVSFTCVDDEEEKVIACGILLDRPFSPPFVPVPRPNITVLPDPVDDLFSPYQILMLLMLGYAALLLGV